jgi:hypothetical protein
MATGCLILVHDGIWDEVTLEARCATSMPLRKTSVFSLWHGTCNRTPLEPEKTARRSP